MDFLKEVEKRLDLQKQEKARIMKEVSAHYHELKDELIDSGMSDFDAEFEASRRMGYPDVVAARLQSVPRVNSWKSAILTALPMLTLPVTALIHVLVKALLPSAVMVAWILPMIIMSIVATTGTVHALRNEKRPDWLAAWSAAAIVLPVILLLKLYMIPKLYNSWYMAITILAVYKHGSIIALAVWLFRKSRTAVIAIVACAVIGLWRASVHSGQLDINVAVIVPLILMNAIALKMFADHEYGNISQSALCLFNTYILTWFGIDLVNNLSQQLSMESLAISATIGLTISGIMILLYSRADTVRDRLLVLILGIFLSIGTIQMVENAILGKITGNRDYVLILIMSAIFSALVVLPPVIFGIFRKRRSPEIVR